MSKKKEGMAAMPLLRSSELGRALRASGWTASNLIAIGWSPVNLIAIGWIAVDLMSGGWRAADARIIGIAIGWTATEFILRMLARRQERIVSEKQEKP